MRKSVAQELVLTLYFHGGHYTIPIHLEALGAYNLDMMTLVQTQTPDADGNTIPSNIKSGSALLSGPGGELDKISVAVSTSVFNVRNATCGNVCIICNGAASLAYSTSPITVPIGISLVATVQLTMNTGTVINNPSGGAWHTSNPAVATVNSSGVHIGVSVGKATSTFVLNNAPVSFMICGPAGTTCPIEAMGITANAPLGVPPQVFSLNPAYLVLGTGGTIFVTGTGFHSGTVSITAPGSMGGGISIWNVSVQDDSHLTVTYSVPCGTPTNATYPFNLSVSNSDGGGATVFPLMLVVGLPQPNTPTIQLNGSNMSGTASVVVGQQIALAGSQSLPACMNLQSQQWNPPTAAGNPVGGFTASTTSDSVTPISGVSPTTSNYTFYWTTAGNSLVTTYQYMMSATDLNGVTVTSGISPPAVATFNVTGPTVSQMSTPTGSVALFVGPTLGFGPVGIQFNPTVSTPPGDSGQFEWAQLITNQTFSLTTTSGTVKSCIQVTQPTQSPSGTGLDNEFPYSTGASAQDSPTLGLQSSTYQQEARSFSATMYFMWDPALPSGCAPGKSCTSVPVSLGSVSWGFSGTASYSAGNWSVTSSGVTSPSWAPSSSYPPPWSDYLANGSPLLCH